MKNHTISDSNSWYTKFGQYHNLSFSNNARQPFDTLIQERKVETAYSTTRTMEWEVNLIEWLQKTAGDLNGTFISALGFLGGEMGLLLVVLIILFCWKKESGKRLALIIAAVNSWLPMIKSVVLRPRPYMEHPDRVRGVADVGNNAPLTDVAAHGYSFPSMHSASVMALFIPLAREVKKKWILLLLFTHSRRINHCSTILLTRLMHWSATPILIQSASALLGTVFVGYSLQKNKRANIRMRFMGYFIFLLGH